MKRFTSLFYLAYLLRIYCKQFFFIISTILIYFLIHFPKRRRWKQGDKIIVVLPRPLGIGDVSMISPLFSALSHYGRVEAHTNFEQLFDSNLVWYTYKDEGSLSEAVLDSAKEGGLICIPQCSVHLMFMIFKLWHYDIVVRTSEHTIVNSISKRMTRLHNTQSFRNKILNVAYEVAYSCGDKDAHFSTLPRLKFRKAPLSKSLLVASFRKTNQPLILVAPYVTSNTRAWRKEQWTALIDKVAGTFDSLIFLLGSHSEHCYGEAIIRDIRVPNVRNLMGQTSIAEIATLCEDAQLFLAVDNGLMHLAVSSATPTIAIFGATPYYHRLDDVSKIHVHHAYQACHLAPCYRYYAQAVCPYNFQCIREVSVEQVFKTVDAALNCNHRKYNHSLRILKATS